MYLLFSIQQLWIYIPIGVVALLLIVLAIILISKKTSKKQYLIKVDHYLKLIEIENKSQIEAYIHRLKNISLKNEDYVQIYKQISAQFDRLITTEREKLISRQRGLKERLINEPKITKGLIEQFKSFDNAIIQYKKEISRIQKDLENYFKEGDEIRVITTELSNKFRQVNEDMEKYSSSLQICKDELNNYLCEIELHFDMLDDALGAARYEEARKKISRIEKLLSNVYGYIETIAQYCNMIEVVIPNQLIDLDCKSKDLESKGYVVAHARVNDFINNTNDLLLKCKNDFKHLCFANFEEISIEIQTKMSEIHSHLDQEVVAQHELEVKHKIITEKINFAESEFIKTKRQFATMLEYYKLKEDIQERFSIFQTNATKLSDLKREFEEYIFVEARHPASFMLEKISKMEVLATIVCDEIDFFAKYFKNVKDYVEQTYSKTIELLVNLTYAIGEVRKHKCHDVYNKHIKDVNKQIEILKSTNQLLMKKPIDIEVLYEKFNTIAFKAQELINLITNDLNNYQFVEKCIVYANPLRSLFKDVDAELAVIEKLFKEGDYKLAQDRLNAILNEYHPAAFDSFKG